MLSAMSYLPTYAAQQAISALPPIATAKADMPQMAEPPPNPSIAERLADHSAGRTLRLPCRGPGPPRNAHHLV
jgi:hypothetical protein